MTPELELWGAIRRLTSVVILPLLLACSDPIGPGGSCEVIYITSESDPTATTGIQIENALAGGLSATVESERYGDYGADMAPGACEVWGFPAGTYGVALQRCEQLAADRSGLAPRWWRP